MGCRRRWEGSGDWGEAAATTGPTRSDAASGQLLGRPASKESHSHQPPSAGSRRVSRRGPIRILWASRLARCSTAGPRRQVCYLLRDVPGSEAFLASLDHDDAQLPIIKSRDQFLRSIVFSPSFSPLITRLEKEKKNKIKKPPRNQWLFDSRVRLRLYFVQEQSIIFDGVRRTLAIQQTPACCDLCGL